MKSRTKREIEYFDLGVLGKKASGLPEDFLIGVGIGVLLALAIVFLNIL